MVSPNRRGPKVVDTKAEIFLIVCPAQTGSQQKPLSSQVRPQESHPSGGVTGTETNFICWLDFQAKPFLRYGVACNKLTSLMIQYI